MTIGWPQPPRGGSVRRRLARPRGPPGNFLRDDVITPLLSVSRLTKGAQRRYDGIAWTRTRGSAPSEGSFGGREREPASLPRRLASRPHHPRHLRGGSISDVLRGCGQQGHCRNVPRGFTSIRRREPRRRAQAGAESAQGHGFVGHRAHYYNRRSGKINAVEIVVETALLNASLRAAQVLSPGAHTSSVVKRVMASRRVRRA